MFKRKPCKQCGSIYHSAMYHKRKSLRPESRKAQAKRVDTTKEWFLANPPTVDGRYWVCYISKHPYCPYYLTADTVVLEHDLSKARRKDLQHDISNIFPACQWDNKDKGSLSAEEYLRG